MPNPDAVRRPTTFASLAVRNYRLYFLGGLVSNTGTWLARVAQDWLVLVILTNGSAKALGLVTTLQFLWIPLLAPWAGTVADRFPKRTVLIVTQTAMLVTSTVMAILALTGRITLVEVYVLASVQGIAMSFDGPTRQAFASEMVPTELIVNAVSLNSASFNLGRLVGPALGGVLIAAVGVGPGIAINAASYVAVIAALMAMRRAELTPSPLRRGRGALVEGVRYVLRRHDLLLIMGVVLVMTTFAMNFQVTNALMATKAFGKGATEFGLLGSIMAVGSLAAALLNARRATPRLATLLAAVAALGVCNLLLAVAPNYPVYAILLMPTGLAMLTALMVSNATVQITTEPALRGRVMALYMAIQQGGIPIGALIIGFLADHVGVRAPQTVGGIACLVVFAATATYLVRQRGGLRSYLTERHVLPASFVRHTPEDH